MSLLSSFLQAPPSILAAPQPGIPPLQPVLLLQPPPRLRGFVHPKDQMASYCQLSFPLFSMPCCPDRVKPWGFSPASHASGLWLFYSASLRRPSSQHGLKLKTQTTGLWKDSNKHLYCVAPMVVRDTEMSLRLLQPGPSFVPVLWGCWLQRCARHIPSILHVVISLSARSRQIGSRGLASFQGRLE